MVEQKDHQVPELPKTIIPWWQDGTTITDELKEPYFLSKGVHSFFVKVRNWLLYPLQQADALTCSESILKLMAWDKDIERFENEPILLFRKRVKYAVINAKDAGCVSGFTRIFERLGIGVVAFKERENTEEWDVCTIELTDSDISQNTKLIQTLIEQYGRTCRRYRFEVTYPAVVRIRHGEFSHQFSIYVATNNLETTMKLKPLSIEYQQQLFIATMES